jgi:tRNA pseudouridine32 synthase/23S rRNA pseudouridine746 synthase
MPDAFSRFQLPPGPWPTVLACLVASFPAVAEATWRSRFDRGRVQDAAGAPLAADAPFVAGREIRYYREVANEPVVPFDAVILHRDDDLVVVDKPHFLATMPAGRFLEQTVLRRLERELGCSGLVPLHRLDRLTAGVLMFSPRPASRDAYLALFRDRRVAKRYEAIAAPLPALDFPRTVQGRLVRGEPFFRMQVVPGEPNSATTIGVLARGTRYWHYDLAPHSGRKHQLRVQMASLGAGIAGDPWYPDLDDAADDFNRPLQLLARELRFADPLTGVERIFRSGRTLALAAKLDGPPSPDLPS